MKSDMLVINKIELAEYVEVDLDQMKRDTAENRGDLPYIFGSMRNGNGVEELAEFLKSEGGLGLSWKLLGYFLSIYNKVIIF